jgi:lysozyme family protein
MAAANFAASLELVLKHEGGWANDPYDPGGATMKGVIQRVYDAYRKRNGLARQSVRHISNAELHEIYKEQYWDAIKGDALPRGVDYCVYDGAVNSGPVQSIKWLQRALGSAYKGKIDGHIGGLTMGALDDTKDKAALIKAICAKRMSFLQALKHWWRFGKGWSRRVEEVRRDALRML